MIPISKARMRTTAMPKSVVPEYPVIRPPLRHVADGISIVGCAFVFNAVVLLRKPRRYFPVAIGTSSESAVIA